MKSRSKPICRETIALAAWPVACTSPKPTVETIESAGLGISPAGKRHAGGALEALAASFRVLPVPILGRIEKQRLVLDLRCLEDEAGFSASLAAFRADFRPGQHQRRKEPRERRRRGDGHRHRGQADWNPVDAKRLSALPTDHPQAVAAERAQASFAEVLHSYLHVERKA